MSDIQKQYDNLVVKYGKDVMSCKTLAERKMLMKHYSEDFKDLALQAEIEENDVVEQNCGRWIKSFRTRSYKGSYKAY
tara:strand:- start:857 stop:1090 length:234 start_codon:yes stop_codon:yes gene_type:complete